MIFSISIRRNPTGDTAPNEDLPPGPLTWNGNRFKKDENGNFRFVYSGKDARAGQNCNAIILELPLAFLTDSPASTASSTPGAKAGC